MVPDDAYPNEIYPSVYEDVFDHCRTDHGTLTDHGIALLNGAKRVAERLAEIYDEYYSQR